MTVQVGRIVQLTPDGKAGLVRDGAGSDHPFVSDLNQYLGDAVNFVLEEKEFEGGIVTRFAQLA